MKYSAFGFDILPPMTKPVQFICLLATCLSMVMPTCAQTSPDPATPTEKKMKPLEISFATLGGLTYSLDGIPVRDYRQFEELVDPLRDFEASRLLKKSENSDFQGKIFRLAGFAGLVTGLVGILATSSNQQAPFWLTGAGGGILINVG